MLDTPRIRRASSDARYAHFPHVDFAEYLALEVATRPKVYSRYLKKEANMIMKEEARVRLIPEGRSKQEEGHRTGDGGRARGMGYKGSDYPDDWVQRRRSIVMDGCSRDPIRHQLQELSLVYIPGRRRGVDHYRPQLPERTSCRRRVIKTILTK